MSDTLFGQEVSGTPLETRGATGELGRRIQMGVRGGFDPFSSIRRSTVREILGFDPEEIGAASAARAALADPTDTTSGLFRALEPFEERTVGRQVGGLRNMFGTLGGRFSRNLASAEGGLRGRLAEGFARTREQSLLQAGALRNQALASLLGLTTTAGQQGLGNILQFAAPGRPNFQEGIAGDILGAAGNLAAMHFFPPGGGA